MTIHVVLCLKQLETCENSSAVVAVGRCAFGLFCDDSLWPSQPRELLPGGFPQQRGPLYLHHKTRAADTDRDDAYSACTEVNNG